MEDIKIKQYNNLENSEVITAPQDKGQENENKRKVPFYKNGNNTTGNANVGANSISNNINSNGNATISDINKNANINQNQNTNNNRNNDENQNRNRPQNPNLNVSQNNNPAIGKGENNNRVSAVNPRPNNNMNNRPRNNQINNNRNANSQGVKSTEITQQTNVQGSVDDTRAIQPRKPQDMDKKGSASRLKVIFLGGIDEIGKNMTAIEYGGQMLIIDAGMTFPTAEMPGVEVIIPDMSYLVENRSKVKGLLLTHGHEDHIGATPFFVRSMPKVPIYGSKLTLALVEHKCRENRLEMPKLVICEGRTVEQIGCFKVEFIKVTHSISGAFALAITAPNGDVVFHTGDFKVDYTPIDGQMMDISRIAEIGKNGVLLMLGESTNVERSGSTMSEKTVGETFRSIFSENVKKRIIIATFASNVHRLQQIIDVSTMFGRRVALSGRSMLNIAEMAMKIGELKAGKDVLIDVEKIDGIPYDKLTIVATGSQGEPMSALSKMSEGNFNKVVINKNDTVILSSSPIPGNERTVYSVINNLYRSGADVIYDDLRDVHVSGHACQDELKLMLSLVKPKFFIPVHGEFRHLKMHSKLAQSLGMNEANIILPELGGVFEIAKGRLAMTSKVTAGNMFVDGLTIDDMTSGVLTERKRLAEDGFIVVLAGVSPVDGKVTTGPEIIYRGMCSIDNYMEEFKKTICETILNFAKYGADNRADMVVSIKKVLSRLIRIKVKQEPMIVPIIFDN